MAIKVRIPTHLQSLTGGKEEVEATAATIIEMINELDGIYPGFGESLVEGGGIRKYINVYINGEDIRFLQEEQTPVRDGDEVTIIPAIAGG